MAYATIIRGDTRQSYIALALDGSSFFIPISLLKNFSLKEHQQLSETDFLALKEKVLYKITYDKAISLIARRDHGKKELMMKLIQKGLDKEMSRKVTDVLVEKNLIDDVKFAYQYIISRQRKNPEGVSVLKMRLKEKMISSVDIERALSQWLEDDGSKASILIAIKKLQRKNLSSEKLLLSMMKKGFSKKDILEALNSLENTDAE